MARVNVEEGAWKKFYKVANYMDWDVRIACGAVVGVWHESQEKVRLTATALELARWGNEHEDADKFVAALVDAEVVRPVGDEFEIVGNADEIASQMKFRERSKKGGAATKAKWEAAKASHAEKKSRKPSLRPATSLPEVGHQLGTIQCSSVQEEKGATHTQASGALPKSEIRIQIGEAFGVWKKTLEHFGISSREMNPSQESSLRNAIKSLGFETVCLALEGQRYETKTLTFDPKAHLSIDRVLHRNRATGVAHWEKLMNLALERRKQSESSKVYDPETKTYVDEGGA